MHSDANLTFSGSKFTMNWLFWFVVIFLVYFIFTITFLILPSIMFFAFIKVFL